MFSRPENPNLTSKKCLKHPRNTFRTFWYCWTIFPRLWATLQSTKVNSPDWDFEELTLECCSKTRENRSTVSNVRKVFLGCFKHFFDVKLWFSGQENIYVRHRTDQTLLNPPPVEIRNKSIFYSTQTRFGVLVISDDQYIYIYDYIHKKKIIFLINASWYTKNFFSCIRFYTQKTFFRTLSNTQKTFFVYTQKNSFCVYHDFHDYFHTLQEFSIKFFFSAEKSDTQKKFFMYRKNHENHDFHDFSIHIKKLFSEPPHIHEKKLFVYQLAFIKKNLFFCVYIVIYTYIYIY